MLKKTLIGLAAFFLLLLIVGFLLPTDVGLTDDIEIEAPSADIHPLLDDLKHWSRWSPFEREDPSIEYEYGDKIAGVGASKGWTSDASGKGRLRIVESDASRGVVYEFSLDDGKNWSTGRFDFEKISETKTRVSWTWEYDVGANIFYRYMMLFMRGHLRETWEKGLSALKAEAETGSDGKGSDEKAEKTESSS